MFGKKKTVLIVDDDKDICRTLKDIFSLKGYEAETVYDGSEAVKLIKKKRFDIVLIDLVMEKMNGVETVRELHRLNAGVSPFIITAYSDHQHVKKVMASGVLGVFEKPLDLKRLIKICDEEIARKTKRKVQNKVMEKTILIVDDDADTRRILTDILTEKGYLVGSVNNGYAALAYLKTKSPHILILDLMMPEKDGLEILSTIKTLSPYTKIVIYTGFQKYEHSVYAREADAFLLKSDDPEKLLQIVEEML